MIVSKNRRTLLLLAGIGLAACDGASQLKAQNDVAPAASVEGVLRMPVARAAHSAVALADGRVLLIGGCVAESCEAGPDSATVDVFDPRTGRFTRAGKLAGPRLSAAAIQLPTGEILIAGGWAGRSVTDQVEIFDPASGTSRVLTPLSVARADIAAARLADGRILLAGGYDGSDAVALVEIFDPRSGGLQRAGDLLTPRTGAGIALLPDGRVLLAGGGGKDRRPTASAEIFDPATARSTAVGSLRQARYKHALQTLGDGRVLAIGGSDHRDSRGKLSSIERFDSAAARFEPAGELLEPRFKIPAAVVLLPDGKLLVAGGASRAELYDPAAGSSKLVGPDFGKRLNFATATLLKDGSVLVAGGYDEAGIRMNDRAWIIPGQRRR